MPTHKEKGKGNEGKRRKEDKGKEDEGEEEENVFYLDGIRVRRSKSTEKTGGFYVIEKGVHAIQLYKQSDSPVEITNPPVVIATGDGWEYVRVREGNEIYGHAVFYLCYII